MRDTLYDAKKARKRQLCWRIDPETGERLERVTLRNVVRKESWDELRKRAAS